MKNDGGLMKNGGDAVVVAEIILREFSRPL